MNWPRWKELCFGCSMNCFASIEEKFTKLWFSQNCDKFFFFFFFDWFCNISTHISSNFLATLRLIIIMFGPLNKNDQKILLTLCTKFKTPVAPYKRFSKLLKFCMMYFITKINKMRDEEVKHLTFDFSWITLLSRENIPKPTRCESSYLWQRQYQRVALALSRCGGPGGGTWFCNGCLLFEMKANGLGG